MGNIFSKISGHTNSVNINSRRSSKPDNQRKPAENAVNAPNTSSEPIRTTPLKRVPEVEIEEPSLEPVPEVIPPKPLREKPVIYKTTFETQVDVPPPHPLEQSLLDDSHLDEIEIETNLFTPEVEDAVIKIQAGFRGYLARKHVKELKKDGEEEDEDNNNNAVTNPEAENGFPDNQIVPPPESFDDQNDYTAQPVINNTFKAVKDIGLIANQSVDKVEDVLGIKFDEIVEKESKQEIKTVSSELMIELNELIENTKQIVIDNIPVNNNNLIIERIDGSTNDTLVSPQESVINTEKVVEQNEIQIIDSIDSNKIVLLDNNTVESVESKVSESNTHEVIAENTVKNEIKISDNVIEITTVSTEILDTFTVESVESKAETIGSEKTVDNEIKIIDTVDSNKNILLDKNTGESVENQVSESNTQEVIPEITDNVIEITTVSPKILDTVESVEPESNGEAVVSENKPKEVFESEATENIAQVIKQSESEEQKPVEKPFEVQMVELLFDEESNVNENKVIAIELFKKDVKEEVLSKVKTIAEPESNKRIEDRVFKTSLDEVVIKPVEQKPEPTLPMEPEVKPIIEEQKIEIITSNSRKNSETEQVDEPEVHVVEVVPTQQPLIQVNEQNGVVLDEEEAAIRIQAAFRGFQIRRSLSREASPGRTAANNNSDETVVNEEQILQNQLSQDLFVNNTQELPVVEFTNDLHDYYGYQDINDKLEKLEDQLLQQLISDESNTDQQIVGSDSTPTNFEDNFDRSLPSLAVSHLIEPEIQDKIEEVVSDPIVKQVQEVVEQQVVEKEIEKQQTDEIGVDLIQINQNESQIIDWISSPLINDQNSDQTNRAENILIDIKDNENIIDLNEQNMTTIESTKIDLIMNDVKGSEPVIPLIETNVEPPTPATPIEITPETRFVAPEVPVLTIIDSTESESELKTERPSQIPKPLKQLEVSQKQLHGILKETDPHIHTNLLQEEQTHSASEEISSPDDDPDFVGLGPNTPIPIRASSPNPFGKKRKKGRKSSGRKN